jgi:hypothetical protein
MDMFDWYEPTDTLGCPVCGRALQRLQQTPAFPRRHRWRPRWLASLARLYRGRLPGGPTVHGGSMDLAGLLKRRPLDGLWKPCRLGEHGSIVTMSPQLAVFSND